MYPCKVRDDLKRFLDSMMSKSGKLRKLVSELFKSYAGDPAAKQRLSWRNKILNTIYNPISLCLTRNHLQSPATPPRFAQVHPVLGDCNQGGGRRFRFLQ